LLEILISTVADKNDRKFIDQEGSNGKFHEGFDGGSKTQKDKQICKK